MFRSTKRPLQNFVQIVKVMRFGSAIIGIDGLDPEFALNYRTYIVIGSIVAYFIFTITSIVKVYNENPTFLLEASCMLGSVLQGVAKIASFCLYTKRFVDLRFELEHIYAMYQEKGSTYCTILQRSCKRSINVIIIAGCFNFILCGGILVTPAIAFMLTGRRYLMMSYEIPGVDAKTIYGYSITMVVHSLSVTAAAFGLFGADMLILIFLSHSILFAEIFEQKIEDLNRTIAIEADQISVGSNDNKNKQIKSMLEDVIEWHKQYSTFNNKCNYSFYYIIAVQITTAGISVVCTLYIFLFGDYPGAYPYVLYPFLGMFAYCFLGTQINNCNDRILAELYNIDWFLLPVSQQKLVLIMLMKAQTPSEIQIGGVIPLTVGTGLQITKLIYSIFMFMVECFDR